MRAERKEYTAVAVAISRTQADPRLRSSLDTFTTVTDQLPKTPAVAKPVEADRIARLLGDGDV
jgi:hypothetical protein